MKKTTRFGAAALAGAALATGMVALATVPASAAPTVALTSSTTSSTIAPGGTTDTTLAYVVQPTTTGATMNNSSWFAYGATTGLTIDAIKVYLGSTDVTSQFSCNNNPGTSTDPVTGLASNTASCHLISNGAFPETAGVAQTFKVVVTTSANASTSPGTQVVYSPSFWVSTTDGTSSVNPASMPTSGLDYREEITIASVVDTPLVAPAIAGIALLGAAGTGAGVFASRRRKANATV